MAMRTDERRRGHMKRVVELRQMSDDHHQGLVQARRLRKAATGEEVEPLEESARTFLEFWV
jgi:hypothetical protein